jgi:hypothetical protein
VFARPEEEPVWTGPKHCGHADLAEGSTDHHHHRGGFAADYPAIAPMASRTLAPEPSGSRSGLAECR